MKRNDFRWFALILVFAAFNTFLTWRFMGWMLSVVMLVIWILVLSWMWWDKSQYWKSLGKVK